MLASLCRALVWFLWHTACRDYGVTFTLELLNILPTYFSSILITEAACSITSPVRLTAQFDRAGRRSGGGSGSWKTRVPMLAPTEHSAGSPAKQGSASSITQWAHRGGHASSEYIRDAGGRLSAARHLDHPRPEMPEPLLAAWLRNHSLSG